jgi:DNA-binding response OmpR family regulator
MSKRILLVDDDESTKSVVTAILMMHGYEVITYADCRDIIENVQKHQPALVIMDLWLPGTGGEYAARMLKSASSTCHIPVVLFSSEEELSQIMERIGAEGSIRKPFDMVEFATTVAKYIPAD